MEKDMFWGYLSQFLQYGAALFVLPLLLKRLSAPELGVWFVFMTIYSMILLLDMGLSPTLARNVSYVIGGARRLLKSGYEIAEHHADVDYGLMKAIIATARHAFAFLSIIALVLLAGPGTFYINEITKELPRNNNVSAAWMIFVVAVCINIYFKYYTPLLQGRSLFAAYYKSTVIANLLFIGVTGVLLQFGMGLPGVGLGFLASAISGGLLSRRLFYDSDFKGRLDAAAPSSLDAFEVFGIMFHTGWRVGLTVVGIFLIQRVNTLLASVYLGLDTTAAYALTLHIMAALQSVSAVLFTVRRQKLAQYRVTNQRAAMRHSLESTFLFCVPTFILGAVAIVLGGSPLIRLIGGNVELLPRPLLAWFGLMAFLDLMHSLAVGVIETGNQAPFYKAAILSGLAIGLSAWIGLAYFNFGVAWLIGCQFVVQLAYNNWQWPWRVYKDLYR